MAAAATCALVLSSCSHAEPSEGEWALVAERIENLEMQAHKLAAGTGASCPEELSALETGRRLRISMFYGHDHYEGRDYDRVNARSMLHVLKSRCRGQLSACGFSIVPSSKPAFRSKPAFQLMRTMGSRQVEINLFTSSLPAGATENMNPDVMYWEQDKLSRSTKESFYRELVESDVVFYMGHSRLGGGMEFDIQNGVMTLFNGIVRLPMLPVREALRQRPTNLKMMGLFSCNSDKHFREDLQDSNPTLSLILTTADVYAEPAEQVSLGALDAILSEKCARAFHESMISVTEPDPRLTYLIPGQ